MKQGLLSGTALTAPPQGGPPQDMAPRKGLALPAGAKGEVEEQQPNVSPEEQGQYDQLVNNAYKALYDDKETLLKSLAGAGDPVTGLAQTVAAVMSRLVDSARNAGKDFGEGVVINAGKEVLEDMADLMAQAGMADLDEQQLESATYLAAEMYRGLQQNNLDQNKVAADFMDLQNAAQNGSLEQVMPGAQQAFGDYSMPEDGEAANG